MPAVQRWCSLTQSNRLGSLHGHVEHYTHLCRALRLVYSTYFLEENATRISQQARTAHRCTLSTATRACRSPTWRNREGHQQPLLTKSNKASICYWMQDFEAPSTVNCQTTQKQGDAALFACFTGSRGTTCPPATLPLPLPLLLPLRWYGNTCHRGMPLRLPEPRQAPSVERLPSRSAAPLLAGLGDNQALPARLLLPLPLLPLPLLLLVVAVVVAAVRAAVLVLRPLPLRLQGALSHLLEHLRANRVRVRTRQCTTTHRSRPCPPYPALATPVTGPHLPLLLPIPHPCQPLFYA